MDAGSLYATGRIRVTELVRDLPRADLDRPVPATPGWTVRDAIAHLTGVAADVAAGRMEGAGSPLWTARQVEDRRSQSVGDLLEEWSSMAPVLEAMLSKAPPAVANRPVCDVACHEHDIRGGLGRPGARHSDTVDQALQAGVGYLDGRLRQAEAPALALMSEGTEWIVGAGEPSALLSTDLFTLFRLLFGRRSRTQMAALEWQGDPTPYLDHLALFGPATDDVHE